MSVTINGTTGIVTPQPDGDISTGGDLAYTGTLTGSTGVLNIGSGQIYKDASGNVGIGTSSPSYPLDVAGNARLNASSNPVLRFAESGTTRGLLTASSTIGLGIETSGALPIAFNTNGSERMRIGSSGNLLVGTTTNNTRSPRLALNGGSVTWSVGPSASNSAFVVYNASEQGVFMGSGSTSWSSSSDERLKTDLVAIENAVDKVKTLRPVTGRFKSDEEGTSRAFLIAQDVLAVFPQAVDASDPEKLGLRYTELTPLLTAAIKEQQAIIESLTARIEQLEQA